MKTIAIVQSNYIPWKGYFDIISRVDEFVIYDTADYTTRDWRNRNRIKTKDGLKWLTVPVMYAPRGTAINAIRLDESFDWCEQHWETIRRAYRQAPCFDEAAELLEALYESAPRENLSEMNRHFLEGICVWLGIETPITVLAGPPPENLDKTGKLVHICREHKAECYLSGPAAKEYMQPVQFEKNHIRLKWMDYSHYPEYGQLHPPFEHGVSIVDLLMHTGGEAMAYIHPKNS